MSPNHAVHRAAVRAEVNPFARRGPAARKSPARHRAWWAPVGVWSLLLGLLFVAVSIVLTLST